MKMDFLRSEFESNLTAIANDGVISIAQFAYTALDILQLAGDEKYNQAFKAWVWDEWIPSHLRRKDELLQISPTNRSRYNDLKEVIKNGSCIPFIGSGMSQPSGMPTWGEFLAKVCTHTKGFTQRDLKNLLNEGDFENAASKIFQDMPPQLFNERFESNFTLPNAISGSVRLLPYLFNTTVVTTNFDTILEHVYREHGTAFNNVLLGKEIRDYRNNKNNLNLLKIHGSYKNRDTRVLLAREYDEFYLQGCSSRNELELIFQQNGLIFIGCSLTFDRTMNVLKEIAQKDHNAPRNFALLKAEKNNKKTKEREHFLAERNIFPIWYQEHNYDIESFLIGFMDDLKKL